MVTTNILDKVYLQKYIYLLTLFISDQIDPVSYEYLYLQVRREDPYYMEGKFNIKIERLLNTYFLDVSDFTPSHLHDPTDKYAINEEELKSRSIVLLDELTRFVKEA